MEKDVTTVRIDGYFSKFIAEKVATYLESWGLEVELNEDAKRMRSQIITCTTKGEP